MTAADRIRYRIAELRKIADAATPGKWVAVPNDDNQKGAENHGHVAITTDSKDDDPWYIARVWESGPNALRDGNFIAVARNWLPALLDALEAAVDAIEDSTENGVTETLEAIAAKL